MSASVLGNSILWYLQGLEIQSPGVKEHMKITKICIIGLFDHFNHVISFDPDERVTVMIGPNGYGKTMILQMLDALFNQNLDNLRKMPFTELNVYLDDGTELKVYRSLVQQDMKIGHNSTNLEFKLLDPTGPCQSYVLDAPTEGVDFPYLLSVIEDRIPSLVRTGPENWNDRSTGMELDLEKVLELFEDKLPREVRESMSTPGWLKEIRKAIPVRFIEIERLTYSSVNRSRTVKSRWSPSTIRRERAVRRCSDNLAHIIQQKLTEYATYAQDLDRSFPARLVAEPGSEAPSSDELSAKLTEVEEKRTRIVDAGILGQADQDFQAFGNKEVDASQRGVLAVYAEDAIKKLSVFDDIYERVSTFKRIANDRFLYKKISIGSQGLKVTAMNGSKLELEMLSSGEQHELVLLYGLLFGIPENSLILIDEPELSLHVAWQRKFLSDLQNMANLSDFRVLLATHSPQIIGDRWDLTVTLKSPDEQ